MDGIDADMQFEANAGIYKTKPITGDEIAGVTIRSQLGQGWTG